MPDQACLGAGVLQTAMRLSISIGLAITAAVYGTTSQTPRVIADIDFPYERAYLCTILFAVVGFLSVPFMRIGKLGGKAEPGKNNVVIEERPRTGGEYSDTSSRRRDNGSCHSQLEHQFEFGSSTLSVDTLATTRSQVSFFPRWSWEDEHLWKANRFRESNIVYEVCIKCLEERKVVVQDNGEYVVGRQQLPGERVHSRREPEELERCWTQLPSERRPSKRKTEEVNRSWTRRPDERRQSRREVERSWQRFPVKLSPRDIETGDVSRGGAGWL